MIICVLILEKIRRRRSFHEYSWICYFFEWFLPLLIFPWLCFFSADPAVVSCRFIVLIISWNGFFFVLFLLELFSEKDGVVGFFSVFLTGFDHTRRAFNV